MDLIPDDQLPAGFSYPWSFLKVVELGMVHPDPWVLYEGDVAAKVMAGLAERYPTRRLVPFAQCEDNDDTACWDLDREDGVVAIVHDFASAGWEHRGTYPSFLEWFRDAIDDMIEWIAAHEAFHADSPAE